MNENELSGDENGLVHCPVLHLVQWGIKRPRAIAPVTSYCTNQPSWREFSSGL